MTRRICELTDDVNTRLASREPSVQLPHSHRGVMERSDGPDRPQVKTVKDWPQSQEVPLCLKLEVHPVAHVLSAHRWPSRVSAGHAALIPDSRIGSMHSQLEKELQSVGARFLFFLIHSAFK